MKKRGFLLVLLVLTGCMVGPNYYPPEPQFSKEWNSPAQDPLEEPLTAWWTVFEDPLLSTYIEKTAIHNKEILVAEANVLQAKALRQVAASSLFPQVIGDFNATKTYFSKNGPLFAIGPSTGSVSGTTSPVTGLPFSIQVPQIQSLFTALFDVAWEIDLFGKTRRNIEAANATIEARIEARNDVLLSALAEVAKSYIEIRSAQQKRKLLEEEVNLLEEKARIIQKQLSVGYVSSLVLENIEATLAKKRASVPEAIALIYRGIYALSVLTGSVPEELFDELIEEKPLPQVPEKVKTGLRLELLLRRPDVREAERGLAIASANIGVAVASFFPTFTFDLDAGFQALQIGKLFNLASRTWAIGGDANTPVFRGGRLFGNLKANQAAAQAMLFSYEQTVLTALQETETALSTYAQELKTKQFLKEAVRRDSTLVTLSEARFTKGLSSMLDFLDAQLQLNTTEQTLLISESTLLIDLITLYKALGGGWEEHIS